ncbi:MAG: hypothetical protein U0790_26365 [Isosphaeraceae bacterium]
MHRRYRRLADAVGTGADGRRGLYPGEPQACRRDLRSLLRSMTQLGLLLCLFYRFQVEGRAFINLVTLATAALPVHYLAPFRWKKPLFLATSLAGLFLVFGTQDGAIVLAMASGLIGICLLPIPWAARAVALGAVGAALAAARGPLASSTMPAVVWPVLASMFMFRILIYMYELKHAKARESLVDTAGYFFLLPNYCFMHFPVVDYRTLQRGYFAADVHAIQRRGLEMMSRGTLHLLAYRLIYHELLISPQEVHDAWSLAGYVACNYLLYLRVSGQFHMACGMLHLFGYQLPDTHHHYLLATGFTDYWRRINIYWKDFMVRLVFNPIVFRLKRRPQPLALGVATVVVFLATWALHAYQSFWLRGTWGLTAPDALFWGVLGVLVLVNVQLDLRRSRGRASARARPEASSRGARSLALAIRGLKTAGTLVTIALLWSLWSSSSLGAWLELMRRGISRA